jgi:hypothetical protein
MVGGVGYRDSKCATKPHAVFGTLDLNSVVTISVHAAASSACQPVFLFLAAHHDLEPIIWQSPQQSLHPKAHALLDGPGLVDAMTRRSALFVHGER